MPFRCIFFILLVAICFSVSLPRASDRIASLFEKGSAIQYDQKEESLALVNQAQSLGIATDDPLFLTLNGGRMCVQSLSGLGTPFTLQLIKASISHEIEPAYRTGRHDLALTHWGY